MLAAGTSSAALILREYSDRLAHGVAVFAGVGNNGGDAYVVAAQLARLGVRVRVIMAGAPRSDDGIRAAALAARYRETLLALSNVEDATIGPEQVVVDGLLGTGHQGELRGAIAAGCAQLAAYRSRGAVVVALDIPSGLNATTGDVATGAVAAHVTTTYGTIKRGLVVSRAAAGRIVLTDIGLKEHACGDDDAWLLTDAASLARRVPRVAWNAHKGTRGHVALVGGATGMAGAIVLATRAALASGIGLARVYVDEPGVAAIQAAAPQAIAAGWAGVWATDGRERPPRADALAIGPGLGRGDLSRRVLQGALAAYPGAPAVLDADALTVIATEAREAGEDAAMTLRRCVGMRGDVVCTPHVGEFGHLLGAPLDSDWQTRAGALRDFAHRAQVTVLLKGTPSLLAAPSGVITAIPSGSPLLATGGSGDLLTGMIGSLLAQGCSAPDAALLGAHAHGLAAELVAASGVRGHTLDDVLRALPAAWRRLTHPATLPPGVLAELPAVGEWT